MAKRAISDNLTDSPSIAQKRCGLLVSIRDAEEAQTCLSHRIDVLDLKEPLAGALGAVPDAVIEQVQQMAEQVSPARRPKLSIALGELADWDFERWPSLCDRYRIDQIGGVNFVKIGLAGAWQLQNWQAAWRKLFAGLPATTQPVVVGYLDRLPESLQSAGPQAPAAGRCPAIDRLIQFAQSQAQVSTILLDTCDKQDDLFASVDVQRLREIIATASQAGLATVVAGSVKADSLKQVIDAGASLVGVRGAVCGGDRSGQLCEQKLAEFGKRMSASE